MPLFRHFRVGLNDIIGLGHNTALGSVGAFVGGCLCYSVGVARDCDTEEGGSKAWHLVEPLLMRSVIGSLSQIS
jgi:hypothetical protein